MIPIPLTNSKNILLASSITNIPVDELTEKIVTLKNDYKKRQDILWAIDYLDQNEKWYDETVKKVSKIEATLDKNLNHKEKTIKLYGWIAKSLDMHFDIPVETDREYADAYAINLILTDHNAYLKILNWD